MSLSPRATALLDFWFGPIGDADRECHRAIWFKSTDQFDAALRREFLSDYEAAAAGALLSWEASAEGALALVLLLDQVPRNIFRETPRAYATDAAACATADRARSNVGSIRWSHLPGDCFSICPSITARTSLTNGARWRCSTPCREIPIAAVLCVVTGARISRSSSALGAFRTATRFSAGSRPPPRSLFCPARTQGPESGSV